MTQMHPVALGAQHGNEALAGPSVTVRFRVCGVRVDVCEFVHMGERDERENRDGTHSQLLNLVSRVCLRLTLTLTKNVPGCCVSEHPETVLHMC